MKWRIRRVGLALCLLLVSGIVFVLPAPLKTRMYYAVCRVWHSYCPVSAIRSLPQVLWSVGPMTPVWVTIEPGITMLLDPADQVSRHILATGEWEPETWHVLRQHVASGGTFIDVGAHIGWYSLKAAKVVGAGGHVLAVEPNRDTVTMLRANINASGAGGIVLVMPVACSDSEGSLRLYAAPRANTGQSSLSSANASQSASVKESYLVPARRLDDIVHEAGIGRVDVIKVDVEGAELLVLRGSIQIIDRYRPVISLEIIDDELRAMGSSAQEVYAFMRAHGYVRRQELRREGNVIFTPRQPTDPPNES